MKKRIFSLLSVILILFTMCPVGLASAKLPALSSSKYIQTYPLKTSGKIYAYTDATLKTQKKNCWIDCAKDECYIVAISGNAVKVSYPLDKGGRNTQWFKRSDFTSTNIAANQRYETFTLQVTTYRHNNGKVKYGYVGANDKAYILGKSGKYTQVIYPLTNGKWKMAWALTSEVDVAVSTDILPSSVLNSAKTKYNLSTNQFKALQSVNNYNSKILAKDKTGVLVFLFEGVGSDASASKRLNAMCVVIKNKSVLYLNKNSSTIPDYPFDASKNGGDPMPTLRSGVYSFSTVNHRGQYAALNVNGAKVVRFTTKYSSGTLSTSGSINVHRRSTDSIAPKNANWVNSAGCQLIGKAGTGKNGEYAQFAKAVGIIKSSADGNSKYTTSVSGKIIVDRSFAATYLKNIGYTAGAIKNIG